MRVTLAQLEAFYWAARLGKFHEAARHLHVAQPTISLRIRDLEDALGVRLFDRIRRDVRLTGDGEVLLELASTILTDVRKVHERLGAPGTVQGVLRAGMPENFALACLPELLRRLRTDYPKLKLELAIGTSSRLLHELEERRIDLAVVTNPQAVEELQFVPLGNHRMVWAAGPGFDLKSTISPGDIRGLPVISNPAPEPQYRMIVEWFRSDGLSPLSISTCTSVAVISELVAANVGLSLLPLSLIRPLADMGRVRILAARPAPATAQVFCAFHASERGANIDALLRAIHEVVGRTAFTRQGG